MIARAAPSCVRSTAQTRIVWQYMLSRGEKSTPTSQMILAPLRNLVLAWVGSASRWGELGRVCSGSNGPELARFGRFESHPFHSYRESVERAACETSFLATVQSCQ